MVKSISIKGFPCFTVTDEQRVKATPKRKAMRSNRVEGAREGVNFLIFHLKIKKLALFRFSK